MEETLTGNPKPSGNISDYNSIEEKEEMCKDMAGYNESLTVNYQQDKIKTIGEKKKVMYKKKMMGGGRMYAKDGIYMDKKRNQ